MPLPLLVMDAIHSIYTDGGITTTVEAIGVVGHSTTTELPEL